jgi:integrase
LHAPKIKLLPEPDLREPYPISWDEQEKFFAALSKHLQQMALFIVNTGCRDGEICKLKWEYEFEIPELNTSVFIIPGKYIKNRQDRLIILNDHARAIVNEMRGIHPEYVFTFRGHRIQRILNSGWKKARRETGIYVRVHDLRHTFGRRLRAAGVSYEDRQDLLGHKSSRITTHYSAAEISKLLEAANKVCDKKKSVPTLTLLRVVRSSPHKTSTRENGGLQEEAISY